MNVLKEGSSRLVQSDLINLDSLVIYRENYVRCTYQVTLPESDTLPTTRSPSQ